MKYYAIQTEHDSLFDVQGPLETEAEANKRANKMKNAYGLPDPKRGYGWVTADELARLTEIVNTETALVKTMKAPFITTERNQELIEKRDQLLDEEKEILVKAELRFAPLS